MVTLNPDRASRLRDFAASAPLAVLACALLLAACSSGASSSAPGGSPGPVASGTAGSSMTSGELRLALIDRFGPRWYCDPDSFPVAHGDEQSNAIAAFPEMQSEAVVFHAVVDRLGLTGTTTFSDAQKLAIYHLWKVAVSIPLDSLGNGRYRFDYLAQPVGSAAEGTRSSGTISDTGEVVIEAQAPAGQPNCPICLARGTLIDTPLGPVAVDHLRLGDPIWTLDMAGRRVPGVVIALGSTPAPADHHVVRLRLADGRWVMASARHPLADGRYVGEIRIGDLVDGARVVATDLLPYAGGETFDLVASGSTGEYFAGGIPMRSTLLERD